MERFEFSFGPTGGRRREEAPFHILVLADVAGDAPLPPLGERKFLATDIDNLDERLNALGPSLALDVPDVIRGEGELHADLTFRSLADFEPAAVVASIPALKKLWSAREGLNRMRTRPDPSLGDRPSLEALLSNVLDDPALVAAIVPGAGAPPAEGPAEGEEAAPEAEGASDLERLLGIAPGQRPQRRPATPAADLIRKAVEGAPRISDSALQSINALIERIDEVFFEQLNAVFHHPAFQGLEATWRGIHYLVSNLETDELLGVFVAAVSREELARDETFEWLGGQMRGGAVGCVVADWEFSHDAGDVECLRRLASVAPGALVAGASPRLLGLGSWREFDPGADPAARLRGPDHSAWRSLGTSALARRIFLAMPRFLGRLPYGARTNPPEGVFFEEGASVERPGDFMWCNAAFGLGVVAGRCRGQAPPSGSTEECSIEGLPVLTYTDRYGDREMMCPVEVGIPADAAVALTACGLTPLLHVKNTDRAVFARAPVPHL